MTKYQWSKEAVRRALNPTQKELRIDLFYALKVKELTPEQANAIL